MFALERRASLSCVWWNFQSINEIIYFIKVFPVNFVFEEKFPFPRNKSRRAMLSSRNVVTKKKKKAGKVANPLNVHLKSE